MKGLTRCALPAGNHRRLADLVQDQGRCRSWLVLHLGMEALIDSAAVAALCPASQALRAESEFASLHGSTTAQTRKKSECLNSFFSMDVDDRFAKPTARPRCARFDLRDLRRFGNEHWGQPTNLATTYPAWSPRPFTRSAISTREYMPWITLLHLPPIRPPGQPSPP